MREKCSSYLKKLFTKSEIRKVIAFFLIKALIFKLLPFYVACGILLLTLGYMVIRRVEKAVVRWFPRSRAVNGIKKTAYRAAVIFGMSDAQFEQTFLYGKPDANGADPASDTTEEELDEQAEAPPQTEVVLPKPNITPSACKVEISREQAAELALFWWDNGGMTALNEVVQEITAEKPNVFSCDLMDYADEISLPTDENVLEQLRLVLQDNGLAADLNEDHSFIICWTQEAADDGAGDN